ncbi:LysR substrate-binding domain-containing protein, partial [Escherichia coli]|nr:LysR substrate-binding domain-containing protein [Escherichia coli]
GGLCIGYIENAMHSGVLSTALRTLRVSRPNVHIALYSQPPATQIEGLRQRSLDFFLVDTPTTDSEQDLEYIQVLDDRMLLALPQNHPLAQEENLVASQL